MKSNRLWIYNTLREKGIAIDGALVENIIANNGLNAAAKTNHWRKS